jgi:predicted nucleotidyltransferase
VLIWPDRSQISEAVRAWAEAAAREHPELHAVGYFGSYARAQHGVGSDVDILVLMDASPRAFTERALDFDATRLPVPADVLVYTLAEWERAMAAGSRFAQRLRSEVVWVLGDGGARR